MELSSFYPVICTERVKESKEFYTSYFNFDITFENEWYVSLVMNYGGKFQLAFVDYRHSSLPSGFQNPAQGLLLNFEVEDVAAEYKRLKRAGLPILLDLRDEEWGQRHFITSDPNGILIDVIKMIPPTNEYADAYTDHSEK